jgi:hypothetical protein
VFKDGNNREWKVSLDAPTIRDIRSQCHVDPISEDGFNKLFDDDILLAEVLAVACAEDRGKCSPPLDADSFQRNLVGDTIDRAREALEAAVLDFCPSHKRELLRTAVAKMIKVREMAMAAMARQMNDPNLDARIEAAMEGKLAQTIDAALTALSSATNSPAPSESSPTD